MTNDRGEQSLWVTGVVVRAKLRVGFYVMLRLVEEGRIGVLDIEGIGRPKYWLPDVEAILEESTRRARPREMAGA
jgi:hypothetical protein